MAAVIVKVGKVVTLTYGADMSFLAGLGAAGSFLSGAGSLASAFGLGRSGGPDLAAQQQFSMQQLQMQEQFAREMAQNSISWRVEDAKRSGISPLVALGAPTFSPPALQVGGVDYAASGGRGGMDYGALGRAGQSFADMAKYLTPEDKTKVTQQQILFEQQVKSNEMDIALKGAQLAKMQDVMRRPSMPSVAGQSVGIQGQGDTATGVYKLEPQKVDTVNPSTRTTEAGPPIADNAWAYTPTGVRPVPNQKALQDTDIFNPEYFEWAWRNKVFPNQGRAPSPEYMARIFPGAIGARWDQFEFEWKPVYPKGGRVK